MTKYVSTQISGYILRRLDDIFSSRRQQSGYRVTSSTATSSSPAFTIVELLVVIVVIGILAAITIVSYSGITNRATISSLQSDLTNASTTLKLDYVSNGTFPNTLASANGGKGITQSQTLDSIIYIPDNTSNPNSFCLEYRKGNNIYAVDNTSAVSSGVCLQNLVGNGDFRSGTSGWSVQGFSGYTITNNEFTGVAINSGDKITLGGLPFTSGHKYYMSSYIKSDSTSVCVFGYDGVTGFYGYSNGSGVYAFTSNVFIAGNTTVNAGQFQMIRDNRSSGWTQVKVKYGTLIDLTVAFGAGNEPPKAQMDTMMSNYSNNWFNIVAKANL